MFESDSGTTGLEESEEGLSAAASAGAAELRVPLSRGQMQRRYLGVWPAMALSLVVSGASVVSDPRPIVIEDSSVVLGYQRPARRRVSLPEARQIALLALRRAEERWERFSDREAAVFMSFYSEAWE